ncbi:MULTISPECIES: restriction endonuclease subunit S [unclassified Streptococcus]|uniref:restriction endonuclease subunit S n=1 Tax=unclassified Streptococcus TaxID=2608887 RepID=UPI000AECB683|nr:MULTISPECIES: restriction endonuclease subunit S [unclassified Streptococcus]
MTRMKESGIDWIGQIPEEWEISKIKFTTQLNGRIGWQGLTSAEYKEEGPYLITGTDFHNGTINFETAVHIDEKRWSEASQIQVENGDLLITKDGTVGKVAIISGLDDKASLNSGVLRIQTIDEIDRRFLYYVLLSDEFWMWFNYTNSGASTILHLYQNVFDEFTFTFPQKNEQQKIADFLDKKTAQMDKVKVLLEKQIQKLKDYRASLIYETVTKGLDKTVPMKDSGIDWVGQVPQGWGVNRLKYLANKIGSGKTPLGGSGIFEETGILFIRSQNIYNGLILLEDKATYINRNIHQQMIGTCVKKNDILLNITGASIGRVAKYDLDIEANVNQHVCIIRSNRYVLPDYLMYFIMSEFGQFMIKTHQISGNREGLSFENIGNFKIIAPGLDYQYEISQYLNKKMLTINQMIKTKEQQIANINKQRQTLIYDYVTGKKRV